MIFGCRRLSHAAPVLVALVLELALCIRWGLGLGPAHVAAAAALGGALPLTILFARERDARACFPREPEPRRTQDALDGDANRVQASGSLRFETRLFF